jgi:hypothetical protein
MTLPEVMAEIRAKGSASVKKIFLRHGAHEPFDGVKVADLKLIAKKIKGDQPLALALYATGHGDAQYLAGMVASGAAMSRAELQKWATTSSWNMVANTIVPWVAVEHPAGFELGLKWIDAKPTLVAQAGWATLGGWAAVHPDSVLDVKRYAALLDRVGADIHAAPNRVRQQMNLFVIMVGTYVAPLADRAIATARRIGVVEVDVGDTGCQIPDAESYILKARRGAPVAPKRKTLRC